MTDASNVWRQWRAQRSGARWNEKAGLPAQSEDQLQRRRARGPEGRPAMKKRSTEATRRRRETKRAGGSKGADSASAGSAKSLTIGLDLGVRCMPG